MKEHKILILGEKWSYRFLTNSEFLLEHPDEENAGALTIASKKRLDFNISDFDIGTARHELAHAYFEVFPIHSANLESSQVEEIFCDMFDVYYGKIGRQAKLIERAFKKLDLS